MNVGLCNWAELFWWLSSIERENYYIYKWNDIFVDIYTPTTVFYSLFHLKQLALSHIEEKTNDKNIQERED